MSRLTVMEAQIADALDDLADLGECWRRLRDKGRMPSGIRQAMLLVAREAIAHVDAQEREAQRQFYELHASAAFARKKPLKGGASE